MRTEPSFSVGPDHSAPHGDDISGVSTVDSQLLSDYRQRYGLSLDPFADDPHFPFYPGGQRRQILEQLLHLCQFSSNLLVVAGDYGVGKTRMAQALIDALDDADDICFVEGQVTSDIDSLLADVFAQFDVLDQLEFSEFCKKNSEQDGLVVLIVDSAHHLSDEVILALINLLQENSSSRLHLVLFAEPHVLNRLERINAPDVVLTDLRLEKFSLVEAVDYLNFRMEMADYLGPEVFAESKVESWWRQSQGQLLSLHEYAEEQLLASVATVHSVNRSKSNQFIPHIVVSSALVGGLMLAYFYWGGESTAKDAVSVAVAPAVLQPSVQSAIPLSSVASSVSSVVAAAAVSAVPTPAADIAAPETARDVSVESSQAAPAVKQSLVPLAQAHGLDNPPVQKSASVSSLSSAPDVQKVAVASESTRVVAPVKTKSPVPAVKPTPAYSAQEKTILSWGASEFTLQLVGLSSEKAAHEFIAEQPNKKDLLLFKSVRQGKDWFVVVTGRFASSAKARQAAQSLPSEQLKSAPWPREVGVIQKEIKR